MTPSDLRSIRSRLGLSQAASALRLGVHARTYRRWESTGKIPFAAYQYFKGLK